MAIMNVFKAATIKESPLDASRGEEIKEGVSDFLTVQSFTNFAMMTGGITAAWHGAQKLWPQASSLWFPYGFAFVWAVISVLISAKGLDTKNGLEKYGSYLAAIFVGLINSFVLGGAVVGTNIVTGQSP